MCIFHFSFAAGGVILCLQTGKSLIGGWKTMIQFENVTKTYAGGKVKAVDGLDMKIEEGKVFGFIGPNGAGKTTTIKLLTGILSPDSGRVMLNGIDMARDPIAAKRSFGYVPDAFDMYERLTGMDYLNFMADLYGVDAASRKRHIEKYLALFELEDAANQQIRGSSRGMKQKLAITGALIHEPSIWVLDEPMVGLDPQSVFMLKEEMRRHADSGRTVFFSTHVLDVAERLCDEIGIIKRGRLIARGTLDELRHGGDSSLEEVFLELVEKKGE